MQQAIGDGSATDVTLAPVVALVGLDGLEHDLLSDHLLDERGLALEPSDRRSVGESLAAQLEYADVVGLLASRHDYDQGQARVHPMNVPAGAPESGPDVWTLNLSTLRPLDPELLLQRIGDLGRGRTRRTGTGSPLPSRRSPSTSPPRSVPRRGAPGRTASRTGSAEHPDPADHQPRQDHDAQRAGWRSAPGPAGHVQGSVCAGSCASAH